MCWYVAVRVRFSRIHVPESVYVCEKYTSTRKLTIKGLFKAYELNWTGLQQVDALIGHTCQCHDLIGCGETRTVGARQFMRCDCEHSRWNREGLWCSFRLWTSTKRSWYSTCSELGSVQFSSVRVLWANLKFVSLRSPRECWSRYVLSVCDVIVLVVITTKSSLSSATNT